MADGVYSEVLGRSRQLSLNKFFDLSTPSMRKVDDGEEKRKKKKRKKRMAFLVATTSLPAVYRPNGYAQTTTAGTPHARANIGCVACLNLTLMHHSMLLPGSKHLFCVA